VNGWLLDTNVISELRRPRPKARVVAFVAAQPLEQLFVSTVTFAEIRYGIEMVSDPIRRTDLNDWLDNKVRPMFDQRVLAISEDVMFKWRLLAEDGRRAGHLFAARPDHRRNRSSPWSDGGDARQRRLFACSGADFQSLDEPNAIDRIDHPRAPAPAHEPRADVERRLSVSRGELSDANGHRCWNIGICLAPARGAYGMVAVARLMPLVPVDSKVTIESV
jgi:predicted nucleic acid-binding protein